ncbi:hypothetical protein C6P45_005024 [Maudiozyma exigua]|uniref:Uncharacterized protein n=1 Tax=Maudiozyma exigua TaxID=34358 RepID=A0A9P7BC55_MAUEX|nr:hypothetical protein C6P45_005024 [Kazachstania exigua]
MLSGAVKKYASTYINNENLHIDKGMHVGVPELLHFTTERKMPMAKIFGSDSTYLFSSVQSLDMFKNTKRNDGYKIEEDGIGIPLLKLEPKKVKDKTSGNPSENDKQITSYDIFKYELKHISESPPYDMHDIVAKDDTSILYKVLFGTVIKEKKNITDTSDDLNINEVTKDAVKHDQKQLKKKLKELETQKKLDEKALYKQHKLDAKRQKEQIKLQIKLEKEEAKTLDRKERRALEKEIKLKKEDMERTLKAENKKKKEEEKNKKKELSLEKKQQRYEDKMNKESKTSKAEKNLLSRHKKNISNIKEERNKETVYTCNFGQYAYNPVEIRRRSKTRRLDTRLGDNIFRWTIDSNSLIDDKHYELCYIWPGAPTLFDSFNVELQNYENRTAGLNDTNLIIGHYTEKNNDILPSYIQMTGEFYVGEKNTSISLGITNIPALTVLLASESLLVHQFEIER